MRIAIDAQISPEGNHGGVEQTIIGLVHALGQLDGPEEYVIVCPWANPTWLQPYLGHNQRIVTGERPPLAQTFKQWLGPLRRPAGTLMSLLRDWASPSPAPATLTLEPTHVFKSLDAGVVHFPTQRFANTGLPSIYSPHDLQHRHYPQFFTPTERRIRERFFAVGFRDTPAIVADSSFVADDIQHQFTIPRAKIYMIPQGPPTALYDLPSPSLIHATAAKYRLPATFAFYPAQTWQHKNHLCLLDALALLRDQKGLEINLVCTGKQNEFWHVIERHVRELRLEHQVHFLGFVSAQEVVALYRLAHFLILPSLFEGGGMPVLEAFREGTPVACSNIAALAEYAGDAALLFDPTSAPSIAHAIYRMATEPHLRTELHQRGTARAQSFSWDRTARMYRAIYRHVAGQVLAEEDIHWLATARGAKSG